MNNGEKQVKSQILGADICGDGFHDGRVEYAGDDQDGRGLALGDTGGFNPINYNTHNTAGDYNDAYDQEEPDPFGDDFNRDMTANDSFHSTGSMASGSREDSENLSSERSICGHIDDAEIQIATHRTQLINRTMVPAEKNFGGAGGVVFTENPLLEASPVLGFVFREFMPNFFKNSLSTNYMSLYSIK